MRTPLATVTIISLIGCTTPHTHPDDVYREKHNVQQDIFCEKGVDAMCIDQHIHSIKNQSRVQFNIVELKRYCEKGNGSACLFLSKYEGKRFLNKACTLKEPRACHDEAKLWMSAPADDPCEDDSKTIVKTDKDPSDKQTRVKMKKEEIYKRVKEVQTAIAYCYNRKLSGLPPQLMKLFEGRVDMEFKVSSKTGEVTSSTHTCSDFHDNEFLECLHQVGKTLRFDFPETKGQRMPVVINYPFVFTTAL